MYASLSQELFMHPLLVLFTLQKHFRKKKLAHAKTAINREWACLAATNPMIQHCTLRDTVNLITITVSRLCKLLELEGVSCSCVHIMADKWNERSGQKCPAEVLFTSDMTEPCHWLCVFVKEANARHSHIHHVVSCNYFLAYSASAVQKYIPLLSQHIYLTQEWYMPYICSPVMTSSWWYNQLDTLCCMAWKKQVVYMMVHRQWPADVYQYVAMVWETLYVCVCVCVHVMVEWYHCGRSENMRREVETIMI